MEVCSCGGLVVVPHNAMAWVQVRLLQMILPRNQQFHLIRLASLQMKKIVGKVGHLELGCLGGGFLEH